MDIETTGLYPWYGDRITCICAKIVDGANLKLSNEDEISLIKLFLHWLYENTKGKNYTLVTFNGRMFDIPFIMTRCALEDGLSRTSALPLLNYPHIDLYDEIQKITGKRMSLNIVARLLGCTPKSGDGLNAIKLWKNKSYNQLKAYCFQDVLTTEEVYFKWLSLHDDPQ